MTSFEWFTPHTPVPEPVVEEDEFNETFIPPLLPEEQQ